MNTNKIWTKLLMAGMLLGLIFTAACSFGNAIKGPDEEALAEQGDAMMTVLKAGDLQAIYEVLSREDQKMLDRAKAWGTGTINIEKLVEENTSKIATWEFDQARIFTYDGALRGELDGKVEYVNGKSGKVQLNLVQQDGTWMLSGWTLEE